MYDYVRWHVYLAVVDLPARSGEVSNTCPSTSYTDVVGRID